jgi:hypothetical protein
MVKSQWLAERFVTRLLWFAIVPVPLTFFVVDWMVLHNHLHPEGWILSRLDFAGKFTLLLIEWQGLALAIFGVGLAGFILKYLTTILDAVLDVDIAAAITLGVGSGLVNGYSAA